MTIAAPTPGTTPPATGPAPAKPATAAQKETAQSFEAVFLGQMTQLMFESVQTGEFSGGHGEEMFRGVLAEKLGTAMAQKGGIGLAPVVLTQILKMQENADNGR
ncbi:rod-binding protein [Sphingomonas sp.]|jgi:Rod binding domain-containing protein|uniref:rod-binding protein n=1 Tax=Sphingomonas sp. TaxID=28214 RepID=UPI00356B2EE7